MARRSAISQIAQIRVESTLGTDPGTGTKRLKSLRLRLKPESNMLRFRGSASKYASVVTVGQEWSSLEMTGQPTYDEIIYPLSSIFTAAVITTPGGGTNSRTWTFTPAVATEDSPKTFTIEQGSSVAAEKASACILNEFAFNLNRNQAEMTGSWMGQLYTTGVALAGSPGTLPMIPIQPRHFDIFNDTTYGGLGGTKLTADFVANLTVRNRYGLIRPINSAKPSWDEPVETEPQVRLAIQVEGNATGQAFVTAMRNNTTQYIRLKATTTSFIEAAIPWTYQMDFVGQVIEAPSRDEAEGLDVLNVVLEAFDDGTNPPIKIAVTNSTTAL